MPLSTKRDSRIGLGLPDNGDLWTCHRIDRPYSPAVGPDIGHLFAALAGVWKGEGHHTFRFKAPLLDFRHRRELFTDAASYRNQTVRRKSAYTLQSYHFLPNYSGHLFSWAPRLSLA